MSHQNPGGGAAIVRMIKRRSDDEEQQEDKQRLFSHGQSHGHEFGVRVRSNAARASS